MAELDLEEECQCANAGNSITDREYKMVVIALLCQIAESLATIADNTAA